LKAARRRGDVTVIFLFPLAFSVVGTLMFLSADETLPAKLVMLALTATAVFLQFFSPFEIHFLVPLALQLVVCAWVVIWWQLD
jgi:hypothetical protein